MRRSDAVTDDCGVEITPGEDPDGKSADAPGAMYSAVPVALITTGFMLAGAPLTSDGVTNAWMETSTPTWIDEGFWYQSLTPVAPLSRSGYGSVQNGPSSLRPGAPCWIHTFGALAAATPPSEWLRIAARALGSYGVVATDGTKGG